MSNLMQRLDRLDDNRTLARGAKKQRRAKVEKLLLTALYLAALTPAVLPLMADALMWPIESRFERKSLDQHQGVAGFIALGGGDERILEAARLARAHPGAKLVITGHHQFGAGVRAGQPRRLENALFPTAQCDEAGNIPSPV